MPCLFEVVDGVGLATWQNSHVTEDLEMRSHFAFRLVMIVACLIANCGCTHVQLQKNFNRQAKTVSDLYEEQVLDNLAMFVCNPYSTPFFSTATTGANNVNDSGMLSLSMFAGHFGNNLSANGSRGLMQSWTLTPIPDPERIKLMQCAYQHAVGLPIDNCNKCCDLERDWNGMDGTQSINVVDPKTGELILDPKTGEPLLDKLTGYPFVDCPVCKMNRITKSRACPKCENVNNPDSDPLSDDDMVYMPTVLTDPRTSEPYEYDVDTGDVTIPKQECQDPCGITCGWVQSSNCWRDVPKCCCQKYGYHCGTYVWVDPCHQRDFSKLVLKIVEYAQGTKATVPSDPTKQVTFYFDKDGLPADVDTHATAVTAIVRSDKSLDDIQQELNLGPSKAASKEVAKMEDHLKEFSHMGDVTLKNRQTIENLLNRVENIVPSSGAPKSYDKMDLNELKSQRDEARTKMKSRIASLKRQQLERPNAGRKNTIQKAPRREFGPPTQYFGGGILQLRQQLNTVTPPHN